MTKRLYVSIYQLHRTAYWPQLDSYTWIPAKFLAPMRLVSLHKPD